MSVFRLRKISIGLTDSFLCIILSIFSCWTIAYHLILLLRLPAYYIPIIWLGLLLLVGVIFRRVVQSVNYAKLFTRYKIIFLPAIGMISLLPLFTLRPDNDDVEFFHRAFLQYYHFNEAVYINETLLNFEGLLPPLSILHLTTSYEYFAVFLAKIIHMDPVIVYQNVMSWIASVVTLITYYCLFRFFGLNSKTTLIAIILTISFFILDGNVHRSFGNVSFVRLWQGKTILWTTLIPICMLVTLKFIQTKSYLHLICLIMVSICSVGLSNSGVYLIPILLGAIVISYLIWMCFLEKKMNIENFVLSTWILIGSFYCSLFAMLIIFGIFPQPEDKIPWIVGWPVNWFENFLLPFGDIKTLLRSLIIVFIVPLIVLPFRKSIFLLLFSLSLFIVCFNPLTGPLLLNVLLPASYWRLVYLLPVPFCFGLLANFLEIIKTNGQNKKRRFISIFGCLLVLMVTLYSFEKTTLSSADVSLKHPLAYKFDSTKLESAKHISNVLGGHYNLLAPDDMVTVLPLINPNVRFVAGRASSVQHYFKDYGLPEEGVQRQNSKAYIETLEPTLAPDFIKSINSGVNGIIVKNENMAAVARQLGMSEEVWSISLIDDYYTVFLKDEFSIINSNNEFGRLEGIEFVETKNEKAVGYVDSAEVYSASVVLEGWIRTPNKLPTILLITDQHNHILSITKNIYERPDVSDYFNDPLLSKTGWSAIVNKKGLSKDNNVIRIFYLDDTGDKAIIFHHDIRVDLN